MTEPYCILAMDAATGPCSVAVWKNGGVSAYLENTQPVTQSACLMGMVEEALATSAVTYRQLTHVACTTGPGSFTGIRVGLAAARGICFAAGINGVGLTTLETMAYGAFCDLHPQSILAILNAGKGESYWQAFTASPHWHAANKPQLSSADQAFSGLAPLTCIVGNIGHAPAPYSTAPITFPRADMLARLAATSPASAGELLPFYIRPPDAKLPSKK